MKISKPKENQIKEYIEHSLSNTNLELEARIVPNFYSRITRENFTDVIKRLKGYGFENVTVLSQKFKEIATTGTLARLAI